MSVAGARPVGLRAEHNYCCVLKGYGRARRSVPEEPGLPAVFISHPGGSGEVAALIKFTNDPKRSRGVDPETVDGFIR